MAEIKNTLKISAPISPYDTNDVYPTHDTKYGKGGYRSVQTLIERDLISSERRAVGMTVFVEEDGRLYSLFGGIENENWVDFESLLGGTGASRLFISEEEPENPKLNDAWLNLTTGGIFYRDPSNVIWTPVISFAVDGGEF